MNFINTSLVTSHWATGLVLAVAGSVVAAYGLRTVLVGRQSEQRVEKEGGTVFLGRWVMEAFYWGFRGLGELFIRLKVAPDTLTWASLAITLVSVPAAALGHFSIAGVFFLLGSVFDAIDGLVARAQGVASDAGEILDAIVDRYADMAPLIGLMVFYRYSVWQMSIPLVALVGSIMVSYVRAKTEAMGLKLPSGLMRRHERITYFGLALVVGPELSPCLPSIGGINHPATLAIIAMVALIANYAAFKLAVQGRRQLIESGRGPGGQR